MNAKPPDLPPPPPDGLATMTCEHGMVRIELKPRFAPWTKKAFVLLIPILILAAAISLAAAGELVRSHRSPIAWVSLCVFGGIVAFLAMMGVAIGVITPSLHGLVTCDGQSLFVTEMRKQFVFPVNQIRSIRVPIRRQRAVHVRPEQPPGKFFCIAPTGALDIEGAQGRVRVFRQWEVSDLRWIAATLTAYLALEDHAAATSEDSPVVDAMHYMGPYWKWLFGASLIAALAVLVFSGRSLYWGLVSRNWPSVVGHVTYSRQEVHSNSYVAQIDYAYTINGQALRGNCIAYGSTPSDDDVQQLVKTHPTGSSIEVFCDPANASRAVLLRGTRFFQWGTFLFGLALLWLSGFLWTKRPTFGQRSLVDRYQIPESTARAAAPVAGDDPVSRLLR